MQTETLYQPNMLYNHVVESKRMVEITRIVNTLNK